VWSPVLNPERGGVVAYALEVPTYEAPIENSYPTLWRFYGLSTGRTLVKEGGVWGLVTSPSEDRLAASEGFFRGGYVNTVSNEVAAELVADGFGDCLTYLPEPLLFNSDVEFNADVPFNSPTF
jgi:hypothetical protein